MTPQHLYEIAKIVGVGIASLGLLFGGLKWFAAVFTRISDMNMSVNLLVNNHLPHIQNSLDAHAVVLQDIKSDVRDMDTKISGYSQRLDDTKESVGTLNVAFLNHLENTAKKKRGK